MKNRTAMILGLALSLAGTNLPAQSEVMDMPLEGHEVAAFEAGLEQVKASATEQEYRDLEHALGYLLYYDLSAKKDKSRLYQNLDGKTPNEIIALIRRPPEAD